MQPGDIVLFKSPSRLYKNIISPYRDLLLMLFAIRYYNIYLKHSYPINGCRMLSLIRKGPITILIKIEKRVCVGHENKE